MGRGGVLVHPRAACPQVPPRVRQREAPPLPAPPPPPPLQWDPPAGRAVRGSPARCETRVGSARFFIVTDAAERRWLKLRTRTRGGGAVGVGCGAGEFPTLGPPRVGGGCAPPQDGPKEGGLSWRCGSEERGCTPGAAVPHCPPPGVGGSCGLGGGHASRGGSCVTINMREAALCGGASTQQGPPCARMLSPLGVPRHPDPRWGGGGLRIAASPLQSSHPSRSAEPEGGGGVHTVPPPPPTPRWGCRRTPS